MNITIDIRTLIDMIGGSHIAALSPDWVTRVISSSASPMLTPLDWKCEADIQAAIERRRQNAIAKRQGNIAVVPIRGVITPRPTIWEAYGFATSVDTIVALTRAAVQDPNVKAVVQAYDSPGGSVFGVEEGFAELLSLRGDTPIIAVAEHLMASAAYWLASAADEIVAAPSALTGSVGVMMLHLDYSKALEAEGVSHKFIYAGENKVEGNPLEPLSEETQAYYQAEVDAVYRQFVGDITRGRNFLTTKVVRGEAFGQGRVLNAADAKDAGMIDQVRTLRDTLIAYGIEVQGSGARALAPQRRRRALALMEKSHSI